MAVGIDGFFLSYCNLTHCKAKINKIRQTRYGFNEVSLTVEMISTEIINCFEAILFPYFTRYSL